MKLGKPFRRQLFHYAEKLLHELLSNIHRTNCPTTTGCKNHTLNELRYKFGSVYITHTDEITTNAIITIEGAALEQSSNIGFSVTLTSV